jgi:hypothetical protein
MLNDLTILTQLLLVPVVVTLFGLLYRIKLAIKLVDRLPPPGMAMKEFMEQKQRFHEGKQCSLWEYFGSCGATGRIAMSLGIGR